MDWKTLGRKLAAGGLPALGTALGGPLGAAVGATVAQRLGVDDVRPDVLDQVIAADPEAAARLRHLDIELEQARAETLKVAADADARAMAAQEANIREARLSADLNPRRFWLFVVMLTVLIAACIGLTVAVLLVEKFPPELFSLLAGVVGALLMKMSGGWDFFFGTSSGSAQHSATIERMTQQQGRK